MKMRIAQILVTLLFLTSSVAHAQGNSNNAVPNAIADLQAAVAELQAGITTRANGGLYLLTTWESSIGGSCTDGGSGAMINRVSKGWAIVLPTDDPDRMTLTLNFRNNSGSLFTLTDTHEMSFDASLLGGTVNNELDFPSNLTVLVQGGEITAEPDGVGTGTDPNHFNNQEIWGGMSDDGSSFTIVSSFIEGDGGFCDLGVSLTLSGVRQRAF